MFRVALTLAASLLVSGPDKALAQPKDDEAQAATAGINDRRTVRRFPANLARGIAGVFHRDTLWPLIAGGVATGGATVLDADMRELIHPTPDEDWGQTLETAGGPLWSGAFVAGMYAGGRIFGNERFRAATYDLVDATVVNAVYFQGLKHIVRRERPNGTNDQSFPSGHTSHAFAVATVFERHYGWKVGVPAYLFAGFVGASRMKEDMHYFSDVVAGAALGYIVGRTVVRVNSRPLEQGPPKASLHVAPVLARRTKGLQVSLSF